MTQEPGSRRIALLRHIVHRQIETRRDTGQHKNRLELYFCVDCIASNQSDLSKKACESSKVLCRVRSLRCLRYRSLHLQKTYVCFLTYGKLVTKATKVSKHSKAFVRMRKWQKK